jgi:hypothetical protein
VIWSLKKDPDDELARARLGVAERLAALVDHEREAGHVGRPWRAAGE